jgi:hypothetical protein
MLLKAALETWAATYSFDAAFPTTLQSTFTIMPESKKQMVKQKVAVRYLKQKEMLGLLKKRFGDQYSFEVCL